MQFHALCRWKHDTTGRIPFFYLRPQEYEQDNVDLLQSSCSGGRRSDLWDRTAYLKANSSFVSQAIHNSHVNHSRLITCHIESLHAIE